MYQQEARQIALAIASDILYAHVHAEALDVRLDDDFGISDEKETRKVYDEVLAIADSLAYKYTKSEKAKHATVYHRK